MTQSTQTNTSKPTITEGIIGIVMTLLMTHDYSFIAHIPFYIFAPIMIFTWNYPILIGVKNKKLFVLIGWQDQHNMNTKI